MEMLAKEMILGMFSKKDRKNEKKNIIPQAVIAKKPMVEEYEVVECEILPEKIICPDCGGTTLEGLDFCDKCGGELNG